MAGLCVGQLVPGSLLSNQDAQTQKVEKYIVGKGEGIHHVGKGLSLG